MIKNIISGVNANKRLLLTVLYFSEVEGVMRERSLQQSFLF